MSNKTITIQVGKIRFDMIRIEGGGDCIIGIYVDENNNTHSLMVDCGV